MCMRASACIWLHSSHINVIGLYVFTRQEFMALTTKASAANHVVDFIPLVEILDVKAEIQRCTFSI